MDEIMRAVAEDRPGPSRKPQPAATRRAYKPRPFESEKLPLSLALEIQPFLRVANQIESEAPRVAYLCRVHAFVKAHNIDAKSMGRGVAQFKTALLHRLSQDEHLTRSDISDIRELKSFYYKINLKNLRGVAPVILEVLKALTSEDASEILEFGEKSYSYVGYNVLPFDTRGRQHAIMCLPEVRAAVAAVRNTRGLPFSDNIQETTNSMDLLDWLQCQFGFQKGNVLNQREHLILLLANMHVRQNRKPASMEQLDDRAVDELLNKTFQNYFNWSNFLGRTNNIWLPSVKQEAQQHKLLYISLYLLIWGEASNLRLMPECLCYIFHHMAYELHGILSGAISSNTGQRVVPAYGGDPESFLKNVVSPLYRVIFEEAQKSRNGHSDHSTWRNYDDLNEYFWSVDCFKLGWPMRVESDFFCTNSAEHPNRNSQASQDWCSERKWLGKTNFVEVRSFWQLFRSFSRMWTFLILALQILLIMAWHNLETPFQLLDSTIFNDVLSIFITNAILQFLQVALDIGFTWKARHNMSFSQKLRFKMKLLAATFWIIALPVSYTSSQRNSDCPIEKPNINFNHFCLTPYMIMAGLYLTTNAIGMSFFFFPLVNNYFETSNWHLCKITSWWAQPKLYIGRGMHECQLSLLKYTIFWIMLLASKTLFSYYFEIKPLIEPTRQMLRISVTSYDWHELFPNVKSNAGAIISVWAPVLLVYFMDTQIWYSIFCTIFGGVYGILHHLGEIRTMGMVRSRFQSLPSAFSSLLIPPEFHESNKVKGFLQKQLFKDSKMIPTKDGYTFALVWNYIITCFREEDLISNREMDLMFMPLRSMTSVPARWPLFLLANKLSEAVCIAREYSGKYEKLHRRIKRDNYMYCAVNECYILLKNILLNALVVGEPEKRIIDAIFCEVEASVKNGTLFVDFKMHELPILLDKSIEIIHILFENQQASKGAAPDYFLKEDHIEKQRDRLIILLQDIFEVLTKDIMVNPLRILDMIDCCEGLRSDNDSDKVTLSSRQQLFYSKKSKPSTTKEAPKPLTEKEAPRPVVINFPLSDNYHVSEEVKRLYLLLSVKEKALDVPTNLEARRRISFFTTSLFMAMPSAPKVRNMLSFSVLTPYFTEEVKFSEDELHSNRDGASLLSYMEKIYPDEWKNFVERTRSGTSNDDIRYWASFRGQTLSRTVRGMMYYWKALKLQAFLDMANEEDILDGYDTVENQADKNINLDALVDMKFTYVVSCQEFGFHKSSGDPRAQDIIDLMIRYPSLRVAYIEEKEEIGSPDKVYSSILVKGDRDNKLDQEIYRIKLPGPPIVGEGKPENQNHAIIFTRGDALQTIDMNQDNYLEETLKMRNLLQEFSRSHDQSPKILGLREHIFTGSVSSLAWFMSYQEASFVTIGQRLLANPLRVRFHYGHPDIFDRIFHLTRGGISKASKTINLSEDVFAGFNSTLRQGYVNYKEYIQVGKGRDVGLNQISNFDAKVANGNSEQTLSRDIYRLGRRFDFFRMLSFYHTTVGFYFNSLISILVVYAFLYGQLYLVLSGLERVLINEARVQNIKSLETALASQSFLQMGLLTGLPMVMELGLEKGFRTALTDFILMQLQLASVFFTFSLGTKSHYYGRTILHGGAKYRLTGRKFMAFHASFTESYQLYSRSHFVKGFEMIFLLIVYHRYRRSYESSSAYVLATYSTWFMAITWLFAPFLFNPSGLGWQNIVEDWAEWNRWMTNKGGIGVQPDKSWESWWNDEQAHLRHSGITSRIFEALLSLRFFIYQYGLVYHLDITQQSRNILVYILSWFVIIAIFILVEAVIVVRQRLSTTYHLTFRTLKVLLFLGVLASIILLSSLCKLSIMDLIICSLAFIPTGWGMLLVAQVLRPRIQECWIWESVQVIAQSYEYAMGFILFVPVAVLAWMPLISSIQTRVLFNQAFRRQLQIQPILAGKPKHR